MTSPPVVPVRTRTVPLHCTPDTSFLSLAILTPHYSHSDTLGTLLTETGVFFTALHPCSGKPLASLQCSSSGSSFSPIRCLPDGQKRKDPWVDVHREARPRGKHSTETTRFLLPRKGGKVSHNKWLRFLDSKKHWLQTYAKSSTQDSLRSLRIK